MSYETSLGMSIASRDFPKSVNGVRHELFLIAKNGHPVMRDGKPVARRVLFVVRNGEKFLVPKPLSDRVAALKKRERDNRFLQAMVYDLCEWMPLSREEISQLIGRRDQYVRKLLSDMVGQFLEYAIPDMIRHPRQTYKAVPGHRPVFPES